MINLDQKITFPKLLVDVGHLGNPQGFVKLVILSLEPRKLEGNEPKINIFQVFDQNREVIAEMQELQGALNLLQVALGYQVHLAHILSSAYFRMKRPSCSPFSLPSNIFLCP